MPNFDSGLSFHRDVKSNNILFDHEFRPHVADFGLAKTLQRDAVEEGAGVGAGAGAMSRVAGSYGYIVPGGYKREGAHCGGRRRRKKSRWEGRYGGPVEEETAHVESALRRRRLIAEGISTAQRIIKVEAAGAQTRAWPWVCEWQAARMRQASSVDASDANQPAV
ncbi:hypothetical protein Ahy_B04g071019 [Arachis hypogaea]|uniref:Protein kinase domain-containing protein n=1 Tax=Arachis hypogaea TaxID=3818 RepID=A0A444ZJX1_ARAHY|nr:hypothetical protein Ahy_B04g071019 [Arachis hypogaea]